MTRHGGIGLAVTAFILGCGMATASHAAPDTVQTTHGALVGVALFGGDITAFEGIRYAQPPTGELRWKPPVPPSDWSGEQMATEFGPACIQPHSVSGEHLLRFPCQDQRRLSVSERLEADARGACSSDGVDTRRLPALRKSCERYLRWQSDRPQGCDCRYRELPPRCVWLFGSS